MTNRKFLTFRRLREDKALTYLLRLWSHCAVAQCDGVLMIPDDDLAKYVLRADDETLVQDLVETGFLDRVEGGVVVHNWEKRNPYCADAPKRIETSRKAGKASAEARRQKLGSAQPKPSRNGAVLRPVGKSGPKGSLAPNPQPNHKTIQELDSKDTREEKAVRRPLARRAAV